MRLTMKPGMSREELRGRAGAADERVFGFLLSSLDAEAVVEWRGCRVVVSGDYKLAPDPTCVPFEPLRCHTFVTESTFGLPIYRWDEPAQTVRAIFDWWERNRAAGRCAVLFGYTLGKTQRILAELMRFKQGIAIAGTHGKTTTTSLVASVLAEGGLDPTFVIGGRLNAAGSNARLGGGRRARHASAPRGTAAWST